MSRQQNFDVSSSYDTIMKKIYETESKGEISLQTHGGNLKL